jgi:V8-like Glu-specific endopeptidase
MFPPLQDVFMTRRFLFSVAAALTLAACSDAPTGNNDNGNNPSFITDGELDGNAHPAVVLIVMDIGGQPAFRCSGTLIAPTVVLTAGHCAGENATATKPAEFSGMRVFTESDVQNGKNNYPFAGRNAIEALEWHSFPGFTEDAFFLHDVGIIHLGKAFNLALSKYGKLPRQNELDALKTGSATTFTAVGYGLQSSNPTSKHTVAEKIRMFAEPHLIQINGGIVGDYSLLLSNNASTGGTCFGDSGGPNYRGTSNVIAGVTSFGLNGTCGGTGGVFRVDRKDVLDFVNEWLNAWK